MQSKILNQYLTFFQLKNLPNNVTPEIIKARTYVPLRFVVDEFGLDEMDNRILSTIINKFKGGPVGINTIATAVGEEQGTLGEVYEPFLIQEGFLQRTPRGREATLKAYQHLGRTAPNKGRQSSFFD